MTENQETIRHTYDISTLFAAPASRETPDGWRRRAPTIHTQSRPIKPNQAKSSVAIFSPGLSRRGTEPISSVIVSGRAKSCLKFSVTAMLPCIPQRRTADDADLGISSVKSAKSVSSVKSAVKKLLSGGKASESHQSHEKWRAYSCHLRDSRAKPAARSRSVP